MPPADYNFVNKAIISYYYQTWTCVIHGMNFTLAMLTTISLLKQDQVSESYKSLWFSFSFLFLSKTKASFPKLEFIVIKKTKTKTNKQKSKTHTQKKLGQ